jgi:K+-transporting ATPase A subunit
MLAILLAPLFVLVVSAIQITAPTNSSGWTTDGSQEIKWNVSSSLSLGTCSSIPNHLALAPTF